MKRVAVILGLAAAVPAPAALAQVPPPSQPAPAGPAPEIDAPVPAAAPPAPATSEPAPSAEPPPAPAPPGDQYYVEKPGAAPPPPGPFEPPLPGGAPFEPPPPPKISHIAPRSSLWLGARLGWFVPFGNLWARAVTAGADAGYYYQLEGAPWSDYASSGPVLEIDAGVRLSRSYTAFLLWERAQLGSGEHERGPDGAQDGGETDFWAIGLRASSDPNRLGFVTEVAIGYRRARTFFQNDVEYQFTDAPFEARLGLGGEYRLSRLTSISVLGTVGVGGFGSAERVDADGRGSRLTGPLDEGDGHGWVTLTVGAHFDLFASKN